MRIQTCGLSALLLAACTAEPYMPYQPQPEPSLANPAADAMPPIDRSQPANLQTATFALG